MRAEIRQLSDSDPFLTPTHIFLTPTHFLSCVLLSRSFRPCVKLFLVILPLTFFWYGQGQIILVGSCCDTLQAKDSNFHPKTAVFSSPPAHTHLPANFVITQQQIRTNHVGLFTTQRRELPHCHRSTSSNPRIMLIFVLFPSAAVWRRKRKW